MNDASPQLLEHRLRSAHLGNERSVWVQSPAVGPPSGLCILLDGEYYLRMEIPAVMRAEFPTLAVVYVSHLDSAVRWPESFCNPRFAAFVNEELIPWAQGECDSEQVPVLLGGLSLTGLSAVHAALQSTQLAGVLCQSASFWWSDSRLVRDVRPATATAPRFRLSCGRRETTDYTEHGPELIQRTSQLTANQAMRDALIAAGYIVSYEEFDGGHELACWKKELPQAIRALLKG